MKHYDNHDYEISLSNEGYSFICGTDEVGRGPLVGPVCAAAVIMPKDCYIEGVTDSKKVSEKNRLILEIEIKEKAISYSISFISNEEIDEINIYEASRKAMITAINGLNVKPDVILSDCMPLDLGIKNISLVKGDEKSFTIACASILAKVARDNLMDLYDEMYPEYNFKKNKGYPTKDHLEALINYGVLPIHRKTYKPVKTQIELSNFYKK